MLRTLSLVAAALFMLASHQRPVLKSSTDLVPVYATVVDRNGKPVRGLTVADFTLTDNGKSRQIEVFSSEKRSVSVAIVFDSTWSMALGAGLSRSVLFARAFVTALGPDDRVALGSLSREIAPLTLGKGEALRFLEQSAFQLSHDSSGGQAEQMELGSERGMDWATVSLALVEGRRIVLLMTDGRNPELSGNASRADDAGYRLPGLTAQAINQRAEKADVSVYAIAFDDTMVEEQFLSAFASTGGAPSLIARDADLTSVSKGLADELHNEYLLGFTPISLDGKSHKIQVTVKPRDLRVRARRTYFAGR